MEAVLCRASSLAGPSCLISSTGCSSHASPSRNFGDVHALPASSASSSYGSYSSFAEEGFGVQVPRRIHRNPSRTWKAVVDVAGQTPAPKRVRKVKETKAIVMVDPVEAKRLAAVEMEAVKARRKLKRAREIEAINGGFAVLGLTAGLIIEAQTGKGILLQIAGYLDSLADSLTQATMQVTPSQDFVQRVGEQLSSSQEYLQNIVNQQ